MPEPAEPKVHPEVSNTMTCGFFLLLLLLGAFLVSRWYFATDKKVQRLHEAQQQEELKKEADREDAVNALAEDVKRHQRPTWIGLLDGHDMSPWVTVPAGYGWTFDVNDDIRVHYRTRTGQLGAETFPKTAIGKNIYVNAEKIKIENLVDTPQTVKLWVYQSADNTARVKMPGGEILTSGAPAKPVVQRDGRPQHASPSVTGSDDQDYPQAAAPAATPQAQPARVVSNGPPSRKIDMTVDCGDRQLALPEPHESPDYSSGLYGVTLKIRPGCWSEWLVAPEGFTPYAVEALGADTNYEISPYDDHRSFAPGGATRKAFTPEERSSFHAIRFEGRFTTVQPNNIVRLLFTKP